MKQLLFAGFLLCFGLQSQNLRNADYLDFNVTESGTADDGTPLNYYNIEGELRRALTGKEFIYYKTVIENAVNAMDAGWINNPCWKKRYDWRYGENISGGMYRAKKQDEDGSPNTYSINNTILPSKEHPLFEFFKKMNDSLYNPAVSVGKGAEHLLAVQYYENNSPRLDMNIHINHLFKTTSASEFEEKELRFKTKVQYKVFKRNDSIWYKNEDDKENDPSSYKFQKNTLYLVLGNYDAVGFTKGITEENIEYKMIVYPNKSNKTFRRVDHIIIELTGHDQSINLFLSKIDWKKLEAVFKLKSK